MSRGRGSSQSLKRRVVWRITTAMPHGEFVEVGAASLVVESSRLPPEPREPTQQGWATSSFDLLKGVEITEEDSSTVPAELFDELFPKPDAT